MPNRKFGRASDQRAAILKNQVTTLIINGRLETTVARAKDISAIVEKLVASAVKEQDNYTTKEITVSAAKLDGKGKKVLKTKTSKKGEKYEVVDREVKTKTVQVDNPSRPRATMQRATSSIPSTRSLMISHLSMQAETVVTQESSVWAQDVVTVPRWLFLSSCNITQTKTVKIIVNQSRGKVYIFPRCL